MNFSRFLWDSSCYMFTYQLFKCFLPAYKMNLIKFCRQLSDIWNTNELVSLKLCDQFERRLLNCQRTKLLEIIQPRWISRSIIEVRFSILLCKYFHYHFYRIIKNPSCDITLKACWENVENIKLINLKIYND